MECPNCGCSFAEYIGIDTDSGDSGDEVCEVYLCPDCGVNFEENWRPLERRFFDAGYIPLTEPGDYS